MQSIYPIGSVLSTETGTETHNSLHAAAQNSLFETLATVQTFKSTLT